MKEILLASASPRRRELLKLAGIPFSICPACGREVASPGEPPEITVQRLARQKAEEVAVLPAACDRIVLAADTVVALSGHVFVKPKCAGEAVQMLETLSGRVHQVYTGVCLLNGTQCRVFYEVTEVEFYPLTAREIAEYVATGEPLDKAGAYGIQGQGCTLVKSIRGDYYNVVGLPVALVKRILEEME